MSSTMERTRATARRPADARTGGLQWDVVVVGAGPSGSVAALQLAEYGHDILLVDKHEFPRDKVCGDGLIPDTLASLRRCGLFDAVKTHAYTATTVSVYSPSQIRIDLPGEFLTIRREHFDAILLDGALARGAAFRHAEVVDVECDHRGVTMSLGDGAPPLRARFGILATGANISLLARAGMLRRRRPSGVALRCYVRSPAQIDELIVSLDRSILPGYAWIFPMGRGTFNVGAGAFYHGRKNRRLRLRERFAAFCSSFPPARHVTERASEVSPLRGATLRCGLDGAVACDSGGRLVAVGESIGTTFPFTGEGIGKAMETGELAARQIHTALTRGAVDPVRQLPAILDRELSPRYRGYKVAESWASRAWLADSLAKRIQRSARLKEAAAGILSESVDPRTVFRWRNLLPLRLD